jgi:2-oxoacid:acceptor oxidoreductase gamma subunit (pyruvate/2-ketoisovalerate family)/2-oxoacid:acceptor oxidoreductase delta subunit (pyruvate/2-ketoisovalerate family)
MNHQSHADFAGQVPTTALPSGLAFPLEVRVHGRGGQGGVTCAKLIALLYSQMGLNVQTFGDYGSERSGAPVAAYTRVDRSVITNRNKIYRPDHLLVLDEGLLGPQVLSGAAPGALLLLNAKSDSTRFAERFPGCRLGVVDATSIAREHGIGSAAVVVVNTTILGAYVRMLGVPLDVLERAYAALDLGDDIAAAQHAYDAVAIHHAVAPGVEVAETVRVQPPVIPTISHSVDHPPTLQTGTWSTQAPVYRDREAPCNAACPAGNDIVGFVQALKTRGAEAALDILLRTQPLPSVCGRVCPAPCMQSCNRKAFDGAVNIRSLERWIADHADRRPQRRHADKPRRIAVVGGGPAGLSAAYQLALAGHDVALYEAGPALGGVLRNGIPAFRLPPAVLQRDIDRILALGVAADCGRRIGADDLAELSRTHDATIVCTGLGAASGLTVPGADLGGVEQGLDFLDRIKRGPETLAGQVLVVGGGNTAIDCARTALRCGAASVKLVYRRSRDDMPAIGEEIEEAEAEGLRLMVYRQPVAFTGPGSVTGVVLAEVEAGVPDASGRRRPVVTERTSTIACDKVLLALGQKADLALLPAGWRVRGERAFQDERPLAVWFAGDCATGDGTVTHAIGNGRRIALAALAALDGAGRDGAGRDGTVEQASPVAPAQIRFSHFEVTPPHRDRQIAPLERRANFAEMNLGLGGLEEAERCFSCGHCTSCDTCLLYCPDAVIKRTDTGYRIDEDYCKGCGMCVAECPRNAMEMRDKSA